VQGSLLLELPVNPVAFEASFSDRDAFVAVFWQKFIGEA
jgi:hypothetical protein